MPLRFNGINAVAWSTAVTYVTPPFSMMLDFVPNTGGVAFSQLDSNGNWNGHYLSFSSTNVTAGSVSNNTFTGATGAADPVKTRWVLVGVWNSATDRRIYLNGKLRAIDTTNSTPTVTPTNTTLGAAFHNTLRDNNAGFVLLRAAIWSCALNENDQKILIAHPTIWDLLRCRPGSLKGAWKDIAGANIGDLLHNNPINNSSNVDSDQSPQNIYANPPLPYTRWKSNSVPLITSARTQFYIHG